jgi:hypothetical protein
MFRKCDAHHVVISQVLKADVQRGQVSILERGELLHVHPPPLAAQASCTQIRTPSTNASEAAEMVYLREKFKALAAVPAAGDIGGESARNQPSSPDARLIECIQTGCARPGPRTFALAGLAAPEIVLRWVDGELVEEALEALLGSLAHLRGCIQVVYQGKLLSQVRHLASCSLTLSEG